MLTSLHLSALSNRRVHRNLLTVVLNISDDIMYGRNKERKGIQDLHDENSAIFMFNLKKKLFQFTNLFIINSFMKMLTKFERLH